MLAQGQFGFEVRLDSPRPGDAVQGVVPIIGNTDVRGFVSYEITFALSMDEPQAWFDIIRSNQAVEDDVLGEWDTNTLTDGLYSLRLIVQFEDEDPVTLLVEGLRVRNYTPIETNTPAPTLTPVPGQTSTPTASPPPPTPTDLPDNPSELASGEIRNAFLGGAIGAVGLLGLLWLYTSARKRGRG